MKSIVSTRRQFLKRTTGLAVLTAVLPSIGRGTAEREEILKHKWYESERAGHDIGFEQALTDWTIKHRSRWLKRRQMETKANMVSMS